MVFEQISKKVNIYVISLGSITGIEVVEWFDIANEYLKTGTQSLIGILTVVYLLIKIRERWHKKEN